VIVKPARFYHNKTIWLIEMKRNFQEIYRYIRDYYTVSLMDYELNGVDLREWLVDNIKGLGMKAASHFLRNQGYKNLAVIDVHIIRFLNKYVKPIDYEFTDGLLPDVSTRKNYLYWEDKFRKIADKNKLSVAELDAIIWKQRSKTEWKDFVY
jgi:N-glycosylase/DNA lyase